MRVKVKVEIKKRKVKRIQKERLVKEKKLTKEHARDIIHQK
jgi:hypothetical protein